MRRWGSCIRNNQATVVALHGFAGTGDDFAPLLCGPQALPGPWLTCDIIGHGNSDAPGPEAARAYDMAAVADALAELLATVVNGPYILLGYSMGGRLVLSTLLGGTQARWPQPAGVVLIGATPGIADPELRARRRLEDEQLATQLLTHGIEWFAEYWATRPVLAGKRRIPTEYRQAMEIRLRAQRPEGLAGSLRGMGTGAMPSLWDALPQLGNLGNLDMPTLMVTGAQDRKFTAIAEEVCAAAPRVERVTLDGVGHTAHLEAPAAFAHAFAHWRRRTLGA